MSLGYTIFDFRQNEGGVVKDRHSTAEFSVNFLFPDGLRALRLQKISIAGVKFRMSQRDPPKTGTRQWKVEILMSPWLMVNLEFWILPCVCRM